MSDVDDEPARHVHDDACWERVSICTARDLPPHACDQACWEVRRRCGYLGLY